MQGDLRHSALKEPCGEVRSFDSAPLNDSQRLAVLLQVAALDALSRPRRRILLSRMGVDESGIVRTADLDGADSTASQRRLVTLAGQLFSTTQRIEGRGAARRAVRQLQKRWQQSLVEIPPDRLVGEVLDAAPFLWAARHADARKALVLVDQDALRVAGPGALRAWILEGCESYEDVSSRLAGLRFGESSESSEVEVPARAMTAYAAGRYRECERLLRGRWQEAPVISFLSAIELGRLHSARRRLSTARRSSPPGSDEFWRVCRGAVRLYANLGQSRNQRRWIARALWQERRSRSGDGHVVAAQGYWDLGRLDDMARHLDACVTDALCDVTEREQTTALLHLSLGRGGRATEALGRALRVDRRRLSGPKAGRLWNDMISARVFEGDLAGAERAARHAFRLLSAGEGPAAQTLALHNLAEVRLRRGDCRGYESLLESIEEENRESHNRRAAAYDLEMRCRLLLFRGRIREAVDRLEEGLAALEAFGGNSNHETLRALACRGWGWLEEPERAAEHLSGEAPPGCFEPEELPAFYALAGDRERAWRACAGPAGALWRRALSGEEPTDRDWKNLVTLEPFRRARMVLDLALCGVAAAEDRRVWATRRLRGSGAEDLALRLSRSGRGALGVLANRSGAALEHDELRAAFEDAGCVGVEISFVPARRIDREVMLVGPGGRDCFEVAVPEGRWSVRAERLSERGERLFTLLARGLPALEMPRGAPVPSGGKLLGRSPELLAVVSRARLLATETMPILIQGESGTGKELLARLCHRASPRRDAAFQPVNCAALTESLALGELFGHVRGAFTGAERDRKGVFEEATGGTVFLDEIGDLHPRAQGMLLRVLQEGEIQRLGENKVRKVDARVVAATHRNLEDRVAEGSFRQDLYFRLRVGRLLLPPLRERGADVELLAEAFAAEKGLLLTKSAAKKLSSLSWPGNVRELKATVEAAAAIASGEGRRSVDLGDLGLEQDRGESRLGYHEWLQAQRRRKVSEALEASDGNQSAAARSLGLSRQAMSYLVRELGVRTR